MVVFHNIYKNNDFYYFHMRLYLFHLLQHVCGHIAILALSEPYFLFLCVSSANCKTDALAPDVLNKLELRSPCCVRIVFVLIPVFNGNAKAMFCNASAARTQ